MHAFIVSMAGMLGLIIGSFLNVVVLRMNTGKGIGGRSECFSCRKTLSWYELIPLASFVVQQGKCRSCRSRISWQYPAVELSTAVLFAGVFARFDVLGHTVLAVFWALFSSVGVVIAAYDFRHKLIPVSGLAVLAVLSASYGALSGASAMSCLVGMIVVPLPFFLLWIVSKGAWIGFGDVEIMACIGLLLGPVSGLSAVVLSFWIACIAVVPAFAFARIKGSRFDHQVPFGPFLILGAYLVGVAGLDLFHMVLNMVH